MVKLLVQSQVQMSAFTGRLPACRNYRRACASHLTHGSLCFSIVQAAATRLASNEAASLTPQHLLTLLRFLVDETLDTELLRTTLDARLADAADVAANLRADMAEDRKRLRELAEAEREDRKRKRAEALAVATVSVLTCARQWCLCAGQFIAVLQHLHTEYTPTVGSLVAYKFDVVASIRPCSSHLAALCMSMHQAVAERQLRERGELPPRDTTTSTKEQGPSTAAAAVEATDIPALKRMKLAKEILAQMTAGDGHAVEGVEEQQPSFELPPELQEYRQARGVAPGRHDHAFGVCCAHHNVGELCSQARM